MRHLSIFIVITITLILLLGSTGRSETTTVATVKPDAGQGSVQYEPIPESIQTPDT